MKLEGLTEVGKIANRRVTDSEIRQRKRILDAKRRMAERNKVQENEEPNASINRISDSARNSRLMRGVANKRAVTAQTRTQDSRAKSYFAIRKRIKDELEETESTEEAIEAAVSVLQEEANAAPEDVLAAVVEVLSDVVDTMPASDASDEAPAETEDYDDFEEPEDEEEVTDSLRRRQLVRRSVVADARKRALVRRRNTVADSRNRAAMRKRVLDALARKRAAAKRIRDSRMRRMSESGVKNRMMR